MHKTLLVIPARGGSKGVPRKNLRPLNGKPLIYYSINSALNTIGVDRVLVSTDDHEIALFARRFGAEVVMRPPELAEDHVTIDPVILHALDVAESEGEIYQTVLTVQPTSPLLTSADIDKAISLFSNPQVDSVVSAVDDRHLRWSESKDGFVPAYAHRVNRQELPPTYKETGAIIGCRREVLVGGSRIGKKVELCLTAPERSIDIDDVSDFFLCESLMQRKKIVFAVIGRKEIGLGHAYRAVMLAHELVNHDILFLCEKSEDLAFEFISRYNYPVVECGAGGLLDAIAQASPDLVINDVLDTSAEYITSLTKSGIKVVNFEDMGLGAEGADLVFNALYPHQIPRQHIFVGPKYFCLRDEFLHVASPRSIKDVKNILLTFGGVDEGDLASRVLNIIGKDLIDSGVSVDIVVGPGYANFDSLNAIKADLDSEYINVVSSTSKMSDYMGKADVAITSGGRTVLELAALQVPTIVICQNERETSHNFASSENGIINLGLRTNLKDQDITRVVKQVISDSNLRLTMRNKSENLDLTLGKKRVIKAIVSLFD